MRIAERIIDVDQPPYIIAELGVNHDGCMTQARALVEAAAGAGADAIKLQLFEADRLVGREAPLATYQRRCAASDAMELLGPLELSIAELAEIAGAVRRCDLHAIVTVFSPALVAGAEQVGWDAYKTASPDVINRPLLDALMATSRPLLVSTGAANADEVCEVTGWLGDYPHLLLHCVSAYPTPEDSAALGGRIAMMSINPRSLGYSDHTAALDTGAAAVAGGACLLEKHLTLDRAAAGPDHKASLDPPSFAEYVRLARRAGRMRGAIEKRVLDIERDVRACARQSLTATADLPAGHVLRRPDLTVKRPGTGISPARLEEVIGRTLVRPLPADVPLTEAHLGRSATASAPRPCAATR